MADPVAMPFELFLGHGEKMGRSLLHFYAPPLLLRLTRDPGKREEVTSCEIAVCWVPRSDPSAERIVRVICDWSQAESLGVVEPSNCAALPDQDVTEMAAVGMMAILIVGLERFAINHVLPIGTAADYELRAIGSDGLRVEVSGIKTARRPSDATNRLSEKRERLLAVNSCGFVSVTAFSHPSDARPHSHLTFAGQQGGATQNTEEGDVPERLTVETAASALSLEGQTAMYSADTDLARAKHTQAGDLLRVRVKESIKIADRHHWRLLVATQYYKAGRYDLAAKVIRRVERRLLLAADRRHLADLRRELRRRTKPLYPDRVRKLLARGQERNDFQGVLALLWKHPYVFGRYETAFLKMYATFMMGEYAAAGFFAAAACRFGPPRPFAVIELVSLPHAVMLKHGPLAAFEAARKFVKPFRHPIADLMASSILYQLALAARGEERREWAQKQVDYFEKAGPRLGEVFQALTGDTDALTFAVVVCLSAAFACNWLGNSGGVATALAEARRLSPGTKFANGLIADTDAFIHRQHGASRLDATPPPIPLDAILDAAAKRRSEAWGRPVATVA